MKKISFLLTVILIPLLFFSCSYFKRSSDTKLIYTVKVSSLNVRDSQKNNAKILGQLYKGDTVRPVLITYDWWVVFDYKNTKGFVKEKYLQYHRVPDMSRVSNMRFDKPTTFIRDAINDYLNWRRWIFWAIAFGSILVAWALTAIGKAIERGLNYEVEYMFSYSRLPYFTAFVGGLYSVVYLFWREDVLQAFFVNKFWWFPPEGSEWLMYYLWGATLILAIALVFYIIRDFVRFKLGAIFSIPYFLITSLVTFICGLFMGVVVIIMAIVWLVTSITDGSLSDGVGFSTSGGGGGGSSSYSDGEDFYTRKERLEEWEARQAKLDLDRDIQNERERG